MNNKIIHGDFYKELPKIQPYSIDLILSDLPYGITACDWDKEIDLPKMWKLFNSIIKSNGMIVLTASQPFTSKLVMSNSKAFKHEWIWNKTKFSNFATLKFQPAKTHESVLVFANENITYNPIMWYVSEDKIDKRKTLRDNITNKKGVYGKISRLRKADDGSRYPLSVLKIPNPINNLIHPTQKPVPLFEYLIKTYTNENDTVLDCCAGSGTAAIASINTNRNFICIEKEEKYFAVIKERVLSLTDKFECIDEPKQGLEICKDCGYSPKSLDDFEAHLLRPFHLENVEKWC